MSRYLTWPFHPPTHMTPEEREIWWEQCYLSTPADGVLAEMPAWTIITGAPGSGKSVTLAALARRESNHAFIIPYPLEKWPGSPQAWIKDNPSHLAQMMACAAFKVRDYLSQHHQSVPMLPEWQQEFVRWLLEKTGGGRAYHRWLHGLPVDMRESWQGIEYIDLFPSTSDALDIQGQIDELTTLAQTLGFQRVLFTIDVPYQEGYGCVQPLADLYRLLELAHHPRFTIVSAIPLPVLQQGDIVRLARGRVSVLHLEWTVEQGHMLAARYLSTAVTRDFDVSLAEYAQPQLLASMSQVIANEYGQPTPAGWIGMVETLLYLAYQPGDRSLPFTSDDLTEVKRVFYARHLPIKPDLDARGVWRGPRFIALDEQPLGFLNLLYRRQGNPANWDDEDVRFLAGSKGNVHTLAARIRKAIEPVPRHPIYLVNRRGEGGYWLENVV